MMALKPEWVNMKDFFPANIHHVSDSLQNTHISIVTFEKGSVRIIRDVKDVTSSGAYGGTDAPEDANREWGEEILNGVTEYLIRFIAEYFKVSLSREKS